MTWTKLSDDLPEKLYQLELTRDARLLHFEAMVHANRFLTDGQIRARDLPRFTDAEDPAGLAHELVTTGAWELAEGGWTILLGWDDQEKADVVERRRAQAKDRQRRHRAHLSGIHDECDPRKCPEARVTRDVTASATRESQAPDPIPSRPEGAGTGKRKHLSRVTERVTDCREACTICGQSEQQCRRRERTSGHAYTPPAPGTSTTEDLEGAVTRTTSAIAELVRP